MTNLASRKTTGPLNDRQREILDWFAKGFSQGAIADMMGLSRQTVAEHMRVIIRKLNVRNSWQACAIWAAYVTHLKAAKHLQMMAAMSDGERRELLLRLVARERRIADRMVEPLP